MSKKGVLLVVLLLMLSAVLVPANAQLGINFDQTTIGNLRVGGSVSYVFGGRAGQSWVVEVTTANFDPIVTVIYGDESFTDDDDGVLASGGGGRNALLSFTTLENATYTLLVQDFSGTLGGRFQIRLTPTSPELSAASTETGYGFTITNQCGALSDPKFVAGSRIALRNNYYPSRLRDGAGLGSNQLNYIPSPAFTNGVDAFNSVLVLSSTSVCRDGYIWYNVSYRGRDGWVAVGRGTSVWWRVVPQ
jgi:hypothetical protein